MIPNQLKSTLVDIGCGLGYFLLAFSGRTNLAIGVDLYHPELKMTHGFHPQLAQASASELPFKDQSVDIIICSEVLEHLPPAKDAQALSEMGRILKPDGIILISVPCTEGYRAHAYLRNIGHDQPGTSEFHYRKGYSMTELKEMIKQVPKLYIWKHRYSMFILSEFLMDLQKMIFYKGQKGHNHVDIITAQHSHLFRIYRVLISIFNYLFILEDYLLERIAKGHILIAALKHTDFRTQP